MKRTILVFSAFLLVLPITSFAQLIDLSYNANTGDAEFDLTLGNLNVEAKADLDNFKADLTIGYEISQTKIEYLFDVVQMEPVDVFMTLELSTLSNRPVEEVVEIYKVNRDKGWGYIAKELDIKLGSEDFKSLKGRSSEKYKKARNRGKSKGQKK